MFKWLIGVSATLQLGLASFTLAATPYVDVEQRLTPEQRHATGIDSLLPSQLALLNQLLRDESAAREQERGDVEPSARSYIGLDDKPIATRLKGSIDRWEPGTIFALENGQQWRVLKGSATLRTPLQSPEVLVVPGIAGRWFLQVDPDLPKARVYRID